MSRSLGGRSPARLPGARRLGSGGGSEPARRPVAPRRRLGNVGDSEPARWRRPGAAKIIEGLSSWHPRVEDLKVTQARRPNSFAADRDLSPLPTALLSVVFVAAPSSPLLALVQHTDRERERESRKRNEWSKGNPKSQTSKSFRPFSHHLVASSGTFLVFSLLRANEERERERKRVERGVSYYLRSGAGRRRRGRIPRRRRPPGRTRRPLPCPGCRSTCIIRVETHTQIERSNEERRRPLVSFLPPFSCHLVASIDSLLVFSLLRANGKERE